MAKERKVINFLPNEIWLKILEMGVKTGVLRLRDLYSVSVTCKLFSELWKEESIWSLLLAQDSGSLFLCDESSLPQAYSSSSQTSYKYRLCRFIISQLNELWRMIEKSERRMGDIYDWVEFIRDKLAQKSRWVSVLIHHRIGMSNQQLEKLSEILSSVQGKGEKVIGLCTQVFVELDSPPVKAHSSRASARRSSSMRSLGGLRKKIDKLLSVHRDKISSYDVACTLVRSQLENFEQLLFYTSRLALLSSGSNPIEMDGVSDDCDYYEGDDYDSDDNHLYHFDYCHDITDNDDEEAATKSAD